jgi:addiction module HigA family antidote
MGAEPIESGAEPQESLMIPKHRAPTHPGEILDAEFLRPLGMTQQALADKMGVPIQRVNTIIAGKRGVTPETAILLAQAFDTSAQFWMNLQSNFDLWKAKQEMQKRSG